MSASEALGRRILRLAIAVIAAPLPALADSWPNATVRAAVSDDAETIVRVTPGTSIGDTFGFAGAAKGPYARAEWLRYHDNRYEPVRTAQLANPVAPIHFAVANDGTLVTLDNWHNVGYGEVVVIYAPDGMPRKSYRIEDLFSAASIGKLKRSVSSIWWRCLNGDPRIQRNNTLTIDDALGGRFTFRVGDGAFAHVAGAGDCKP